MSHWPLLGYLVSFSITWALLPFPKLSLMLILNQTASPHNFPQSLRFSCSFSSFPSKPFKWTEINGRGLHMTTDCLAEAGITEAKRRLRSFISFKKQVLKTSGRCPTGTQEETTMPSISDWIMQSFKKPKPKTTTAVSNALHSSNYWVRNLAVPDCKGFFFLIFHT